MGPHSYGRPHVIAFPNEPTVRIGRYCSVAPQVTIFAGGNHRVDWVSTYVFNSVPGLSQQLTDTHPASKGPVIIENDVWIGYGATVMSGVRVGDGAVVAARAVVTRDVRPYAIVAGCPAREVRRRFSDAQIAELLAIAWWNWSDSEVESAVPHLCSAEIETFIERYRRAPHYDEDASTTAAQARRSDDPHGAPRGPTGERAVSEP